VTFWNARWGTGATATSGSTAISLSRELAPIELYTAGSRVVAWIDTGGQRVTDLLNSQHEIRLWQPTVPQEGTVTPSSEPGADNGEWQTLAADQIVLAMPPEWRTNRQLRIHRKLRRVAIDVGQFSITGNAHVPFGTEPGLWMLDRGRRFLPLTDVHILHRGEPPFEHVVSMVIVNTAQVSKLVPLFALA
jgi:hypothetical protein